MRSKTTWLVPLTLGLLAAPGRAAQEHDGRTTTQEAGGDTLLERVEAMVERADEEIGAYRKEGGDDGPDHPGRKWAAKLWKEREAHPGTPTAALATVEAIHLLLHAGRREEAIEKATALEPADGAWPKLVRILFEAAELEKEYGFFVEKAEALLEVRAEADERAEIRSYMAQAHWIEGDAEAALELVRRVSDGAGHSERGRWAEKALYEIERLASVPADRVPRSGRDLWQRPVRVMESLGIGPGDVVADVGSGRGYFTLQMAERVGSEGAVLAVEIDEGLVGQLRSDVAGRGMDWVVPILGLPDDPRLPDEGVDAALVVDTYHEMRDHAAMMQAMFDALRPGGRLGIIDVPGEMGLPREEYFKTHSLPVELLIEEVTAAGFRLRHYDHDFIRRRSWGSARRDHMSGRRFYLAVFEKPPP